MISLDIWPVHLAKEKPVFSFKSSLESMLQKCILERLHDVSAKVRRKAVDIVCGILERRDAFDDASRNFLSKSGLSIVLSMLNSLVSPVIVQSLRL